MPFIRLYRKNKHHEEVIAVYGPADGLHICHGSTQCWDVVTDSQSRGELGKHL